jgi:hypothetical protein
MIVVEDLTGDDLAFDVEGNAYVATNPSQTVALKMTANLTRA